MGMYICLEPKSNFVKFDFERILEFMNTIQGVYSHPNGNDFTFAGLELHSIQGKGFDITDETRREHTLPLITIDKERGMVFVSINWCDNSEGDTRKFTEWLLQQWECKGQDYDGYEYASSKDCMVWVNNWLEGDI